MTFRRNRALSAFASWLIAFVLIAQWPLVESLASRMAAQSLRVAHDLSASSLCGGAPNGPARGAPVKSHACPICQAVMTGHAAPPESPPQLCPAFERGPSIIPESSVVAGVAPAASHLPRGPPPA